MIRRLVAYWHRSSEVAALRDRAVIDAKTIAKLRRENARLIARQDQLDALTRNLAHAFAKAGHTGQEPRCPACRIVRTLTTTTNTRNRP